MQSGRQLVSNLFIISISWLPEVRFGRSKACRAKVGAEVESEVKEEVETEVKAEVKAVCGKISRGVLGRPVF